MKNWKTTISGLLAALGLLFPIIGLPAELGQAISVIGVAIMGIVSKDNNVTGGTVKQ